MPPERLSWADFLVVVLQASGGVRRDLELDSAGTGEPAIPISAIVISDDDRLDE